MPLTLYPELANLDRAEMEARLEQVRLRRMNAAMTYAEARNTRTGKTLSKLDRQLAGQADMLAKELVALDRQLAKVEKRVNAILMLQDRQYNALGELIHIGLDGDSNDDED